MNDQNELGRKGDTVALQNPDAGGFEDEQVRDEFLAFLRVEADVDSLSFTENPVRLLGGFDTLIFAFSPDGAPQELAGPLIVRVFPDMAGQGQAKKEAVFQNAMADAGYAAPRVLIHCGARTIAGRAFNVMERVSGHSPMEDMMSGPEVAPRVTDQLARAHVDLHDLPSGDIAGSLRESGVSAEAFTTSGQLRFIERYAAEPALSHLTPLVDWLVANRPEQRDELSICHGDFHPGNIMVDGERVSGILDWPGAVLADAEYDVAASVVLITVGGSSLAPDTPPEIFEAFAAGYLDSYSQQRTLDPERLRYYRASRAVRAFLRRSAARTSRVARDLAPRDQYPWTEEGAVRRLARVISETTGIDAPLPPGVEPA